MSRLKLPGLAVCGAMIAAGGLGAAVYATVSSGGPAGPSFGHGDGRVDHQAFAWRNSPVSTSSTSYIPVAGLHDVVAVCKGGITAIVSASLSGAPVDIRVRDANTRTFKPGPAHFEPLAAETSFSFAFVSPGTRAARCHLVGVEWRSPTGQPVTLARGDLAVLFDREARPRAACD